MSAANSPLSGKSELQRQYQSRNRHPSLMAVADLLTWDAESIAPLSWRYAFDGLLKCRTEEVLAASEGDDCLAQGLGLLPVDSRMRFLRAPAVSSLLLRKSADGRRGQCGFNGQIFAKLLIAELAAEGLLAELPASCWTARGDRFLDTSWPDRWREPGASLGNPDFTLDESSPFQFPDDEFGMGETIPYQHAEREFVQEKLLAAIKVLRSSCTFALNLVTTLVEVLALRREPATAKAFYSSTFWGYAGLVRFANAHLPEANTAALTEALVHEATHCLLHVHEELDGPFLRVGEANHPAIQSPWTGNKIRLISYVHACAVWYGIFCLWSTIESTDGVSEAQIKFLKQRAHSGFEHRPVSRGLVSFDHLLTENVRVFLRELEKRMLSRCN